MSVRPLLASLTSTVILMAPGFIALFPEPNFESSSANDSWQRGVVLLPLFFAATTLACLAAGRALMAKGYQSIRKDGVRSFNQAQEVRFHPWCQMDKYHKQRGAGVAMKYKKYRSTRS